ncbi:bifunctional riboflavin kinase/FAD synthetase [Aeromicrobium sp.]|uniref:bifunctional riboflavin kinase/FAD synthetase n=1 Tax=Aeromicrobium sp. TaxID=1871063 RepID=UPI003D6B82E8
MTIWRDLDGAETTPRSERAAVTVGVFDGVHRGHQHVLAATRAAAADGASVVAVTFEPHPLEVLTPDRTPKRLTTVERRIDLLHAHGADEVRVLAFDQHMSAWTPEEFIQRVLADELRSSAVVVGENFRFGSRAAGDVDLLRRAGAESGFTVEGLALDGGAEPFSSTLVRAHVATGHLPEAAVILGRPHEVSGEVVEGDRRGRSLGFPTANIPVDDVYAVPPDGVYAGRVDIGAEVLAAAISVGTNPTFGGRDRRVESYIIDRPAEGGLDLYGKQIRVELVRWLRGMDVFDTVDALVAQMHEDVADTRTVLAELG